MSSIRQKQTYKMQNDRIAISRDIIQLIDHLASNNDIDGLRNVRVILTKLIMSGAKDESSFIDISEYCDSVVEVLAKGGKPEEDKDIVAHRKLIESDFKSGK